MVLLCPFISLCLGVVIIISVRFSFSRDGIIMSVRFSLCRDGIIMSVRFSLLRDGIIKFVRFSLSRGGIIMSFVSVFLLYPFGSVYLGMVLSCPFG